VDPRVLAESLGAALVLALVFAGIHLIELGLRAPRDAAEPDDVDAVEVPHPSSLRGPSPRAARARELERARRLAQEPR
jgi:hypothetical protein